MAKETTNIKLKDGTVIGETWNKSRGTYDYSIEGHFVFGVFERFAKNDLQNLYDVGYFDVAKPKKISPRVKAVTKYNSTHVKQVKMSLNLKTDADILEELEKQENVQGYIKNLIRQDLERKAQQT